MPPLGAWEGAVEPFSMEELEASLARGKKGKSRWGGPDQPRVVGGHCRGPGGKGSSSPFLQPGVQGRCDPGGVEHSTHGGHT